MAVVLACLAPLAAHAAEAGQGSGSLVFDAAKFTVASSTVNGKTVRYRAYEGIVYVTKPVDIAYETMNIYVPAEYYEGKSVGQYTAETAPIFLPNTVGGYMPGAAGKPGVGLDGKPNAALVALSKGLVVAEPGARGRTLQDSTGHYTGKAPAAIVDLKAAVRYLRANDGRIPGSSERIVSNGTSAGGALSALLGASGNSADYQPYLAALGAADARDDIYAVSAYCPITNLDNADSAYEWLLGSLTATKDTMMGPPPSGGPGGPGGPSNGGPVAPPPGMPSNGAGNPWGAPPASSGPMSAAALALSAQLKALFPAYVNGLGLTGPDGKALRLDAAGNGSFKDYVKSLIVASAQSALKKGTDLSRLEWVKVANGVVVDIDLDAYVKYCGRKKGAPAFDAIDLSSGENSLYGTASLAAQHFTAFGQAHDAASGNQAAAALVTMMNPMAYIGAKGNVTATYWRIRHGTVDSDTALAIPAILATKLANSGYSVDFSLPWDQPHSGDYDLDELFAWIGRICQ